MIETLFLWRKKINDKYKNNANFIIKMSYASGPFTNMA